MVMVAVGMALPQVDEAAASAGPGVLPVEEVRSTYTAEFGVPRPVGVAAVDGRGLVVAGAGEKRSALVELTTSGRLVAQGTAEVAIEPGSLVFDARSDRLVGRSGGEIVTMETPSARPGRQNPRRGLDRAGAGTAAATFDSGDGSTIELDGSGRTLRRVSGGTVRAIALDVPHGIRFGAVAVDASENTLYLIDESTSLLYAFDEAGAQTAIYDLGPIALGDVTAMVVAPSADATDDSSVQHLFVSDAGTRSVLGRVVEIALVVPDQTVALAAGVVTGTLVRTIATSSWSPASPDPSGIVYLPGSDRFVVVDSEVEETTGAGYHGVNMWVTTRAGVVTDTGTTHPAYSKEPTGLGARTTTSPPALFISDDSKQGIHVVLPGADDRFGTADDSVTFINTAQMGTTDVEDPEYDPVTGHLFFLDGVNSEVYDLDPVDGVFGNGNDIVSHFDIGVLGASDFEGLSMDVARGTLLVGAKTKKKVYEITKSGSLVQTIDLTGISGLKYISGLALAPASDGSGRRNLYIVDRAVDNDAVPSENDGKMFEIALPVSDAPPTVQVVAPVPGATVSGTTVLSAAAADDVGVASVQFSVDGTVVGTDTNSSGGWTVSWNSTAVADGSHTLMLVATDTIGQTATSSTSFVVDNVDSPPTVAWSSPAAGAALRGTVTLVADASDDVAVSSVRFVADGATIATDSNGSDGWSAPWNTSLGGDGTHSIEAVATDSAGQSSSAVRSVTTDNSVPTVAITAPAAGATVSGQVVIDAGAADAGGLASVTFLVDGVTIATDANGTDGWSASWNTITSGNGTHSVSAIATDAAGNTATATPVTVTVANAAGGSVDVTITSGADDVEEKASNGNMTVTSTDLDLMLDRATLQAAVGLRFQTVQVPAGATVTNAYLQFEADEVSTTAAVSLVVAVQDTANAPAFTTAKRNITSRALRAESVTWVPPAWAVRYERGTAQRTPDLAAMVQGVVANPGWSQGNSMVFVITGTGSGTRVAGAFEGGRAPTLHIEYVLP